jgi:hypothetical protein
LGELSALLSRRLQEFIENYVRTVWAVELLLLLRREPREAWAPEILVRELRGSAALVEENLGWFVAGGLVRAEPDGRHIYDPASPMLSELCDELEATYRERPMAVMNAIMARANPQVKSLADAFRFRNPDK